MSFFSEDRAAELRDLFFETAQELLQALNDAALELEKRPSDAELLREVQRIVHTLKGDSAACGYHELSRLAHELEDVLTPELAVAGNGVLAEVVLVAADTFHEMLTAYRGKLDPGLGEALRTYIRKLIQMPAPKPRPEPVEPRFAWSEYDQKAIAEALARGETVWHVGLYLDPKCALHDAALQLIRNVLQTAGTLLALNPDENTADEHLHLIEAALASEQPRHRIAARCQIPSVVTGIVVEKVAPPAAPQFDLLQELLEAEAEATSAARPAGPGAPLEERADAAVAPPGVARALTATGGESSLRVDPGRIDAVLNLVGELIIGKSMLHQTLREFDRRHPKDPLRGKFADAMAFQSRVLDDLQKSVMRIRMVPVEQLFRRFPRVVRDVAKLRGKDVALTIAGQDTDLDKSILDAVADPLTHLVRNAVDHGVETATERIAAGKPPHGTVSLNSYYQGNQAVIEVSDDGRGIDHEKILARAVEQKHLTAEDAARLNRAEALELIFQSGFSTAGQVTEISGRGVGLDVVRSGLERLKGSVRVESQPGRGTTFALAVPLTLTSVKALLFLVNERLYAVPLTSVVEIARVAEDNIHRVDNHEVLQLRDHLLTLVRLNRLESRPRSGKAKSLFIIVVAMGDRKFGLAVDRLKGEEELVIKPLDHHLVATDVVSGASILGDGAVVLILNLSAVIAKLAKAPAVGATA